MLKEKLIDLQEHLVRMAHATEEMVRKSVRGLIDKDRECLDELVRQDEPKVNEMDVETGSRCIQIIALHEPKASDLRAILAASHMARDLERTADHAVNIARSAAYLIERPPVKPLIDIPTLCELCTAMLRGGIDAYILEDSEMARAIMRQDDRIDELRDQVVRELVTYMLSDATTIERALHLVQIVQNLERVADLATNLCEEVIYLKEGQDVRHQLHPSSNQAVFHPNPGLSGVVEREEA